MLDTARYRTFLAMELGVSVEDISALLMGGHGDTMVPLPSCTSVGGIPVTQLIEPERLEGDHRAHRQGRGRDRRPAEDRQRVLRSGRRDDADGRSDRSRQEAADSCAAYCDKEYGVGGYYVGVPVILGASGVEKIMELKLERDREGGVPEERRRGEGASSSVMAGLV